MKNLTFLLYIIFTLQLSFGQQNKLDSITGLDVANNIKTQLLKELSLNSIDGTSISDYKTNIKELISYAQKTNNNEIEPQALQLLAEKYKRAVEIDSALLYISKSIKKFQYISHDSLLIKAYNSKAGIYNYFQKYDSAVVYFEKAINLGKRTENLELLGYAYHGYSATLSNLGRDIESLDLAQKSLTISKKNNFKKLELLNLKGLGWNLLKVGNYEKSISYLEEAYRKYEANIIDDKEVLCDILRFMTLNYRRSGKQELVHKYGTLGIDCFESTGNTMLVLDVLNTIGASLLEQEKYQEAIPHFERLIKKSKSIKSQLGVNFGRINLTSALINTDQFNKGETLLLKILKDTVNTDFLPKRLEKVVYQNLSEVSEKLGNYKSSLLYHQKFKFLEDSLNSALKFKEITDIDARYQTEKKEKENQILRADNNEKELQIKNKENKNLLLTLFLVSASFIIAFLIYVINKRRKDKINSDYKYKKELEELTQEKADHREQLENQYTKIDTLEKTIADKEDFISLGLQDKEDEFHNNVLKPAYNLTAGNLEYWIDQSNGLTEKLMVKKYSVSESTITSKGKRLKSKIKLKRGIQSNITLSKEEMLRIYKEEWKKFYK